MKNRSIVNLSIVFGIAFAALRFAGVIHLSWWLVLLPIYVPFIPTALIILGTAMERAGDQIGNRTTSQILRDTLANRRRDNK